MLVQNNDLLHELCHLVSTRNFDQKKIYLANRIDGTLLQKNQGNQRKGDYQIGYPKSLKLVAPSQLKPRKLTTPEGRAAMVHAIAHIEYTAIHLALDAIIRYPEMPVAYYENWWQVAQEEAKHYQLLADYLHQLGYVYGDFPAHSALWELADETSYDVLARMALVPRIMEARGLDVTPVISDKFAQVGAHKMVEILAVIFQEEIRHVAIGNYWFHWLCQQRGVSPLTAFKQLVAKHVTTQIKKPFHAQARLKAGFSTEELVYLNSVG